jgi:hypothetical protein
MAGKKTSNSVDKAKPTEPFKPERKSDLSFSGSPEDGQRVEVAKEDSLRVIFGTEYPEISEGLLGHCLRVLKNDEANDDYPWMDQRPFMISAVAEIKPRDTIERMLSVQMAATHVAMIRSGRWLSSAETVEQVNAHYSGYTKLARAYVAQMEALRKHRNGGKQTVTVQHVNVNEGGQAVVGNVEAGGRVSDGK